MAAVKGVNRTLADDPTGSNILAAGLVGGNVKVTQDTYEASALASASTINIGRALPANARIISVKLGNDALGASVTLVVGDSNDPNRYITSQDASTAGVVDTDVIGGMEYVIGTNSGDDEILVTTGGASATGTIQVSVTYSYE